MFVKIIKNTGKELKEFYCESIEVGLVGELLPANWYQVNHKDTEVVWVFRGCLQNTNEQYTAYEYDNQILKVDIRSGSKSKILVKKNYKTIIRYFEEWI